MQPRSMSHCRGLRGRYRLVNVYWSLLEYTDLILYPTRRPEGNLRCSAYSPCGRYFAWASPEKYAVSFSLGKVLRLLTGCQGNCY